MKKTVPCLLPLLLAPHKAFAVCVGLSLSGLPATSTFQGAAGEYRVFDPAEYMQTVNFTVGGGAAVGTCDYFVALSTGGSGNANQRRMTRGADTLDYNVYTTAAKTNILKDAASAGAGQVISGSFPTGLGQSRGHSLYWTINPLQVVSADAARFQDVNLTLTLYSGLLLGIYLPADTATITFRAKAESSVDLSLVDSGGAFNAGDTAQTVDFGTLSSGEQMSFDTVIRSNDGYLVTLQSQNNQTLKHLTHAATVPYTLTFGGGAVDLSSGAAVQATANPGATTPAAGDRFETKFTIGTLTGSEMAGNYQDVITVTVSAN